MKQHPIYAAAFAKWKSAPARPVHIDTADVAKLIRAQLKQRFPGVKFSVRIDRYAGGSSVRVNWEDGPIEKMVSAICQQYRGEGFDGMQDMRYNVGGWLMPDGSAQIRQIAAHWGADEHHEEAAKDGAIPASFGGSFIFCNRSMSMAAMQRALQSYAARYRGDELADAISAGQVAVQESKWGGWELSGNPRNFRGVGEGSAYGGDTALRSYAARRMIAA